MESPILRGRGTYRRIGTWGATTSEDSILRGGGGVTPLEDRIAHESQIGGSDPPERENGGTDGRVENRIDEEMEGGRDGGIGGWMERARSLIFTLLIPTKQILYYF